MKRIGCLLLKGLLTVLLALVGVYAILALTARPAAERPFFTQFDHAPLVMAHRGGKGLWPENTLYAFEQAASLGADVLEMDIHSTADGVPVVMHDRTVDRTTDGSGAVHALTLEQIKALDAGYNWTDDGGQTYPYRGQGITVPTVEEVFAAFPDMPLNIEIKQSEPSITASFCRLIRAYGMEDKVLVVSFDDPTIRDFRSRCPEVATAAAQNEMVTLLALGTFHLEAAYSPAAQAAQVPEYRKGVHVLTPRFVEAAHKRGLQVHAWTINEESDMRRLLDLGVDGIISDYPDRLLRVLGR